MSVSKTAVEFSIDSKRDFVTLLSQSSGSSLNPESLEILALTEIAPDSYPRGANTQAHLLFQDQPFTIRYRRLDLRSLIVDTHRSTLAVPDPETVTIGDVRAALLAQYRVFLSHDDIEDLTLDRQDGNYSIGLRLRINHLTWLPVAQLPLTTPADIRHWLTKRELPSVFL